jgi:hypothetical protein
MTKTRTGFRTRRGLRLLATMGVWMSVVVTLVACSSQGVWFHPRTPTVYLDASTHCPSSVGKARDVRNPGASTQHLVPTGIRPTKGLICIYGGQLQPSTRVRQIVLNRAAAARLSAALSNVSLQAPPAGPVNCPNDTGGFAIISLASTASRDSNVWWVMTGCQTLDNGSVGATQVANNSFASFGSTITSLIG